MQGECLLRPLFVAYRNAIKSQMNNIDAMGERVNSVKISVIMYADDLVLIAKDKHSLQLGMNAL